MVQSGDNLAVDLVQSHNADNNNNVAAHSVCQGGAQAQGAATCYFLTAKAVTGTYRLIPSHSAMGETHSPCQAGDQARRVGRLKQAGGFNSTVGHSRAGFPWKNQLTIYF
ncbi:UNVERIFIED_CONTAM: hypothetical protein FKN15_071680 [Acipenser sinensis]